MTDLTKSEKMREGLKADEWRNWQKNFCHLQQFIFVVFHPHHQGLALCDAGRGKVGEMEK